MFGARQKYGARRLLGMAMLVVACLLGPPAPLDASAFASPSSACGASCPCEEPGVMPVPAHSAPCSAEDGCVDELPADAPDRCPDECPDGCSQCGCCPAATATLPFVSVTIVAACFFPNVSRPAEAPASADRLGVFRPPRSVA